ncbi:MAG TPA: sigma-70 family RNA polymerase sigma factor [Nocardioides sp.]|jgi:RNA polymerase sigma-70 factor (ECF subfamily)|nr:sigma-70 family RNA polymerase sigma factor [Nocardioides sp.]
MAGATSEGGLDPESARWVERLSGSGRSRESCVRELHELLLRAARREVRRRSGTTPVGGRELDDVATQAANDATYAVLAKVGQFRGESRFTTWAYRFVVLEVSHKLGRHFWRQPRADLADEDWARLPDVLGAPPDHVVEVRELTRAVRRAVDDLTEVQRRVFEGAVLQGIPLDALAVRHDTTRNALYKALFDARRKIRAHLVANGYLGHEETEEVQGS